MEKQFIYFFVYYPRTQVEESSDIVLTTADNQKERPEWVFSLPTFDNDKDKKYIYYKKIFKIKKSKEKEKKGNQYYFEFSVGDDKYAISFEGKGKTFVYEVILKVGKRILTIQRKIEQTFIEYNEKISCFVDALEKYEEEEDKRKEILNILFNDSIELYSKKKGFGFLISLFLKIYQNEDLCPELLKRFKKLNADKNNLDRKEYLMQYTSKFEKIITSEGDTPSEVETLLKNDKYDFVEFYGIILCYLHYYDYQKFTEIINKLSEKDTSRKKLYEILLIYNTHFTNHPIEQNFEFFDDFIKTIIENAKNNEFQENKENDEIKGNSESNQKKEKKDDKDNKAYSKYIIGLNYIKDIDIFLKVIDENKEEIYATFIKPDKDPKKHEKYFIKMDKSFKFKDVAISKEIESSSKKDIKSEESFEMDNIAKKEIPAVIKSIESILNFSSEKDIFLIYLTSDFWKYLLNFCRKPIMDNIYNCSNLRKRFKDYHQLVKKCFPKKDKLKINTDANNLWEIDEFAILIDKIIKKYNDENKDVPDIEKLSFITTYNPYYQKEKENKYANKAETDILDFFDINKINEEFIENFRDMNFEIIFEANIHEYISKIISKIKNISSFENVIKLINFKNIEVKNIILIALNKNYDKIILKNILNLSGEKLQEALRVIAILAILNFAYEQKENKKDFINNKIKRLDVKIKPFILIEIIKICINKQNRDELYLDDEIEFKDLKDFIFDQFAKKVENDNDIQNIIKLIECIEELPDKKNISEIINELLKKVMDNNKFTKDEFFSSKKNPKISLLYQLYIKGKFVQNDEDYSEEIIKLLIDINNDIIKLNIKKKKLEEFLSNEETIIRQRLSLIKILSENTVSPDEKLEELKKKNNDINNDIENIKFIYNNIKIYYKVDQKAMINKLFEAMKDNDNKEINQYKSGGKIGDLIKDCENSGLSETARRINKVKDFLLFKVIYEMNAGNKNDESNFMGAYKIFEKIGDFLKANNDSTDVNKLYEENKDIFDKIRENLSINETEAEKFVDKLKSHYSITNEKLIDDLNILFKSKKYELEINSIIYFFKFFKEDKTIITDWNNKIPETYKDLSEKDFKTIKTILVKLQKDGIYDYQYEYKNENENKNKDDNKNESKIKDNEKVYYNYNRIFTCLYGQKEAIDFIFEKINQKKLNLDYLKNKMQATSKTLNIKDVIDTEECICHINKMNLEKTNMERLNYIKSLKNKAIEQFENYSKIYLAIIELDRSDDFSDDVYDQVFSKIEEDLTLNILQDEENFMYFSKKDNKFQPLSMKDLIDIKKKIPNEKENETEKNNDLNDTLKDKLKTLIFFKNLVTNLEIITKYMKVLREKGCSLPIKINIKVKMHNVNYYLEDKEVKMNDILDFLLNAKNIYISKLNSMYKDKVNLRFLYGKQFRSMMQHIEKNYKLDSFLRYILNITDHKITIKEGDKGIHRDAKDYIALPEMYIINSFEGISSYITNLFKRNDKPVETHYDKLRIKPSDTYKGIYKKICKKNTMEKFIINLFWNKLEEVLPVAQNVLITSKETSTEEIQSFLHRAILCNYNTLFVIEINESFTDYQQNVMNSYIDQLLTYKNNKYNDENEDNVDRKYTQKYLDSCIAFIYSEDNKNITSFLKEIRKFEEQNFDIDKNLNDINIVNEKILVHFKNIKVITSDICGLGKSGIIKSQINKSNKIYFHFPLGGILTKNIIYDKLKNLLDIIKNYNYKDVAIHLDLTESKEKSIINEFFFSFLITKFYLNNANIIYIPNNIDIYIEIPNCFENYLSQFGLLNIFNRENITFETRPDFNYGQDVIDIFKQMLKIDSNPGIQDYVKKNMGFDKYSFHQINIFIKIFISQFKKLGKKSNFNFTSSGKDVTGELFSKFASCTQYFTNGNFAKLLTKGDKGDNNERYYIDKLTESYDDDLKRDFNTPIYFINKEEQIIDRIKIPSKDSDEFHDSLYYLKKLKKILSLPNELDKNIDDKKSLLSIIEDKDNNYVITNDNFKKMILLIYRIQANVPVIIMGETGCGKTALITKLNQIINNGKTTVEIINIHPGINDDFLCKTMKEKDDIAKKKPQEDLWLFFDEINTCLSLSLITEIFINRTYNGNAISENIRLIGACNPYRRRKKNKEKSGLSLSEDNKNELVYLVQPLPQSLLYYVFSFGSIDDKDERKYISSIIKNLFTDEEIDLHKATTEAISKCHIYLRKTFDSSVVSLREIARFVKCVEFFKDYFSKKNENFFIKKNICMKRKDNLKNNKIRSIICSIYLCYYIRLIDDKKRTNFDVELRETLFKLVNTNEESFKISLFNKIIRKDEDDKEDDKKISEEEKQIIDEILKVPLTQEELKSLEEKDKSKNKGEIKTETKVKEEGKKEIKGKEEDNNGIKMEVKKNDEIKNNIEKIELSGKEIEIAIQKLKKDVNKENLNSEEKAERIRYFKEVKLKYKKYYEQIDEQKGDLVNQFKNNDFKVEISLRNEESLDQFSDLIKIEQNYLLNQIDLDKGIGKNTLLKENLFLLFVSVITNIPLIIIGKPGSGKSLSAQLIYKSMKGEYSKNHFFKLFPRIIQTYFQGSKSTEPKDVESLFTKAGKKLIYYKKKKQEKENENLVLPISMILFDELGLAELSDSNPLKVLHSKLEYGGKEKGVSFVGISNYTLDAAKINRALILSVPDLDQKLDEIIETSRNIVESIYPNIKDDKIFKILSNTYFEYKSQLQKIKEFMVYKQYKSSNLLEDNNNINNNDNFSINSESNQPQIDTIEETVKKTKKEEKEKRQFESIKEEEGFKELLKKEKKIRKDFHGNRDFYSLIKGTANDLGKSIDSNDNEKVGIIIKYIERNFGGIDYEINIDFNLILDDIKEQVELIHNILKDYELYEEGKITKLKSVYLFKALYNIECDKIEKNSQLKIDIKIINNYNLNNCINDNIRDNNSRFSLLEVKHTLTTLIFQNIKLQNQNITKDIIQLYDGSPFVDDNNKEYRFKKINEIQEDAKKDKLIVIENLNQIHPFLFDLYNRNFQMINGRRFARICLDNFDEQLTEVNNGFRIIILVDKKFVNKCDLAFLNRMEKMILSFDQLLDEQLKIISTNLIKDIKLKNTINIYENVNYSLKNLLINCDDEEIQGLIYYFYKESKNERNQSNNEETNEDKIDEKKIRENVIDKIYKILPQDIIAILPNNNILRNTYFDKKNIFNFNDYINDENYQKYKISIIYTFTTSVDGLNSGMSFMISEIKSENDFKTKIDEIKNYYKDDEKKYICIHFDQSNSKNIKFICNFILKIFDDIYRYIIIIHINRNFNTNINERIYSLPDIKPEINQIFIDNLADNNIIKLRDILNNDIQNLLNNKREELKLDDEFDKTLKNFFKKELNDNTSFLDDKNEYIRDLLNYMEDEKTIKDKIIEVTYNIIENVYKDNESSDSLIEKIYNGKFINTFTLDIVSCLIEYIKEEIFNKYLKKVFEILEDCNILTTLLVLKKNNYKQLIERDIVNEIVKDYLKELTFDENYIYKCKFLYGYNVPGFYKFYVNISNYISKNISSNYYNNEKMLRELVIDDKSKKKPFQDTEDFLLNNVYNEISINYKFVYDRIDKIEKDLIFNDYITYFLQKYRKNVYEMYNKDDIYHKIILLLLDLRFNGENIIVKSNNNTKILLTRIIWLESNINYVLNILKLIDIARPIFNDDNNIFYNKIQEEIINKDKIKIRYITTNKRNSEMTKEVNECYYILLAKICYSITSEDIQLITYADNTNQNNIYIEINDYNNILKEINNILQSINDDLRIFLNEMYIIDELIKVIEIFQKKNDNIEKINIIKNQIRENALIIQKYYDNPAKLSTELIDNFINFYNLVNNNDEIDKTDIDYYNNLRYIFYKEIRKVSDIDYRFEILDKLLEEDEMIKKSNDIFQMVLKEYLKREDKFKLNKENILKGEDRIIKLIDSKLNNKNVLEETILYLFEKNSLIYYKILQNKKDAKYLDDEPLDIFNDCINYLFDYINNSNKMKAHQNKEVCKLFCLGYIKTFCAVFIKMFDANEPKWKDPKNIINVLNGKSQICKMIRIYIYKILFKEKGVDFFYDQTNIEKFKLGIYSDFVNFIQNQELNNIYKIDYKVKTINPDSFDDSITAFEKLKKENFKNPITKIKFNIDDFGIDNFYIVSYNSTLSYLRIQNNEINDNFFTNICQPLFTGKNLLLKALELFYKNRKYSEIKNKYKINSQNINPFLFGYRYCLNELSRGKTKSIYYPLYDSKNIKYLKEKMYPGNDMKINKVLNDVINHFKTRPNEPWYVCLCEKGYYHCIPSGFPGISENKMFCPQCNSNIGCEKRLMRGVKIVNRTDYCRIFYDDNEIKKINRNPNLKSKLREINYMTLKELKERFIGKSNENTKGIYKPDENSFKNVNKIVRNLSQISFRILNFILYSHLFFAKLITNKDEFEKYLPGKMNWITTISECWKILENELKKLNIDSIDEFMNYIFVDIFNILNKENYIEDTKKLNEIETNLETTIQENIKNYKEEKAKLNLKNEVDEKEINSANNILKEKFKDYYYKKEEFPFYKYLYYTAYLNEKYILKELSHMDKSNYPVLAKYLDEKNDKLLDDLHLFNSTLNLISQKYLNNISREAAEKKILEEEDIYKANKTLIEDFIKFYNDLNLKSLQNKHKLSSKNYLVDFFVDDNNDYGKTYKIIYEAFIKKQNEKLGNLLQEKIDKGIFDVNCKNQINVQQMIEQEIFTLKLPKNITFFDILFNYSYRKALDSNPINYKLYKEYEINYDFIEDNLTEILVKNKKLLNNDISVFIYNNEMFNNQITNIIKTFKTNYNCKKLIFEDKVIIYKFCKEINNNKLYYNIINGFIELFKFLNNLRSKDSNSGDNKFKEDSKIYEVLNELQDPNLDNFKRLFAKNDGLIVSKISEIFDYYLKAIFESVYSEIKNYQENELDENIKNLINNYFKTDSIINKIDFAYAIRLLITLVLLPEENKDKKIRENRNNIINYLKKEDCWKYDIDDNKFIKNLNDLKEMNIKINQIIPLYDFLGKDIDSKFFNDVEQKLIDEKIINPKKIQKEEKDNNKKDNDKGNTEEKEQDKSKEINKTEEKEEEDEEDEEKDDNDNDNVEDLY